MVSWAPVALWQAAIKPFSRRVVFHPQLVFSHFFLLAWSENGAWGPNLLVAATGVRMETTPASIRYERDMRLESASLVPTFPLIGGCWTFTARYCFVIRCCHFNRKLDHLGVRVRDQNTATAPDGLVSFLWPNSGHTPTSDWRNLSVRLRLDIVRELYEFLIATLITAHLPLGCRQSQLSAKVRYTGSGRFPLRCWFTFPSFQNSLAREAELFFFQIFRDISAVELVERSHYQAEDSEIVVKVFICSICSCRSYCRWR